LELTPGACCRQPTTAATGSFSPYAILYDNLEAHLMWVEAHPLPVRGEDDGD
jgi:hypothetical protein